MTHGELLQKLADIAHNKDAHDARNRYLIALRAVVDLHKPMFIETEGGEFALCSDCSRRVDLPGYGIQYPCKTIQVIDKELM